MVSVAKTQRGEDATQLIAAVSCDAGGLPGRMGRLNFCWKTTLAGCSCS